MLEESIEKEEAVLRCIMLPVKGHPIWSGRFNNSNNNITFSRHDGYGLTSCLICKIRSQQNIET